ncbi:glycosyl hydrolase 53 family protein [Marinoscillum sp.]|uniref:glycosyl hydrolase 53 family protein n=1 Tax=Marinoscillum sp. TaxID=2024838 RepID=UPI003BA8963F
MMNCLQQWGLVCLALLMAMSIPSEVSAQFAKGADVSWLSEMEASGYQWYNDNGNQEDLFEILKDHGMNSIRLRAWVNPSGGWSDTNDMLYLAGRASNAGMDIMLTIHYSDSWADPGQQNKPSAWSGYSTQQLYDAVYSYTHDIISTMQSNGVTPKWVQIGNETNNGMLWENGRATNSMQTYAWLVNSGHNAVKDVNSSIQTIVHLANGNDNGLYQWNIGGIISEGANFDIIGMSLYPEPNTWQGLANDCLANMQDMKSRYGKEVMICEIGMRQDEAQATRDFIADMLAKTRSVNGLGVFYWEPQVYDGWKGYGKGAWQESGQPSIAMDAFLEGGSGGGNGNTGGNNGSGQYVQFRNRGSNLYLDGMGRTTNGDAVGQWGNTTHPNSRWELISQGGNYYQLQNVGTGLFLDGMGRTTNGADVGQWSNTTSYNSHWELIQYSGNYYQLRNRSTGLYLDGMGRTTNGDAAGQWANTTHVNSQWEMISTSGNRLADESEVFAKEQVQFYPNPINEKLYINLGSTTNAELKLLDTSGKVLRSHKVGTIETINVAQLKPGIYLLEISTPDQTIRSKVIKQ